jgi:hypothetical protein
VIRTLYILRDEYKSCRKFCPTFNFSTVRTRYSGLKPIVISCIRKGNVWGREEVLTGVWWGNLTEADHLEDPGEDVRIILK